MKNLNSFKAITRAIEHETIRQIDLIEKGEKVWQETRRWDDNTGCSFSMRSKEEAKDYRYFPEPDLVPLIVDDEWITQIKKSLPQLREEKIKIYTNEYGLPLHDAKVLTASRYMAEFFEETLELYNNPKKISNWLMGETMRLLKENSAKADTEEDEQICFSPINLVELIKMTEEGVINNITAKEVFEVIFKENINPKEYVIKKGLMLQNNEDELKDIIAQVIKENPEALNDYNNGKAKAIGFFVGQVMKKTKGKADPATINKLLPRLLKGATIENE